LSVECIRPASIRILPVGFTTNFGSSSWAKAPVQVIKAQVAIRIILFIEVFMLSIFYKLGFYLMIKAMIGDQTELSCA
jgi:hypothetical protein